MAKIKRFLVAVWSMSTTGGGMNFVFLASIWLKRFQYDGRIEGFTDIKTVSHENPNASEDARSASLVTQSWFLFVSAWTVVHSSDDWTEG